jgi:hypothetical protein
MFFNEIMLLLCVFRYQKAFKLKVPKKTMRLLSQKHAEYKGKEYEKFWMVVPSKIVKKLGWKKGQELKAEVEGKKLVVEKS